MQIASRKDRFIAICIDWLIWVGIELLYLLMLQIVRNGKIGFILFLLLLSFMFIKDWTGQSPGKRIMKLKIVRKKDYSKANPILMVIRNLFYMLGIIELLIFIEAFNGERLGDKITKTIVIKEQQ